MADALVDGPPLTRSNGALRLGETGDSQKSDESTPEKMTLKRAGSALRTMSGVDRALSGDEVVFRGSSLGQRIAARYATSP